jgi:hypothetical protein
MLDVLGEDLAAGANYVERTYDPSCGLSAVCVILGNFLRILLLTGTVGSAQRPEWNFEKWTALNPGYLRRLWQWRRDVFGVEIASGMFTTMAWCLMVPPVLTFCWSQSRSGRHLVVTHLWIALLAMAGATFEGVEILMTMGSASTCGWISSSFEVGFDSSSTWTQEKEKEKKRRQFQSAQYDHTTLSNSCLFCLFCLFAS